MTYNFQRWMSRFPQRWRTQRNAIRNANCKTSWIIKILNAHCAFGIFLIACLFECLWIPLSTGVFCTLVAGCFGFDRPRGGLCLNSTWRTCIDLEKSWLVRRTALTFSSISGSLSLEFTEYVSLAVWTTTNSVSKSSLQPSLLAIQFRISNQARWPAEFKHIIKRRKRN